MVCPWGHSGLQKQNKHLKSACLFHLATKSEQRATQKHKALCTARTPAAASTVPGSPPEKCGSRSHESLGHPMLPAIHPALLRKFSLIRHHHGTCSAQVNISQMTIDQFSGSQNRPFSSCNHLHSENCYSVLTCAPPVPRPLWNGNRSGFGGRGSPQFVTAIFKRILKRLWSLLWSPLYATPECLWWSWAAFQSHSDLSWLMPDLFQGSQLLPIGQVVCSCDSGASNHHRLR